MLVCEGCGQQWAPPGAPGAGWWQSGRQMGDADARLMPYLSYRHDFCSLDCLQTYYQRAGTDGAPTTRLPELARKGRA